MSSFATERATESNYEDNPSAPPALANLTPLPELHAAFTTHLNAKSIDEIIQLLSADVRLQESAAVDAQGLQGKEQVEHKLVQVCKKMGGLLQNATDEGHLMKDEVTTKTVLQLKKGMIRLTVGCSIVWFGGLIRLLILEKGATESFMIDTTPPPLQSEEEGAEEGPPSSLLEPFLVPRPPSFPPPTLTLKIQSCSNLVNAPHNLRPINPYVKVKLPSGTRHVTKVIKLNKNPTFTDAESNGCILGLCLNHSDKVNNIVLTSCACMCVFYPTHNFPPCPLSYTPNPSTLFHRLKSTRTLTYR